MKKIFSIVIFCSLFFIGHSQNLNVLFKGKISYGGESSALWGYTAPNGKEYALMGAQAKLSIVDISNPSSPVEVASIGAQSSPWHEIKTWSHYAYMVSDNTTDGVLIADLQYLPDSVPFKRWYGEPEFNITRAHTLQIDSNGILYLNGGSKILNATTQNINGTTFHDLKPNPWKPKYLGFYNNRYVHDNYIRGDTMYSAEVYDGYCSIIDITDKSNPVVLNDFKTPQSFTHNTWLSGDGLTLYTTDEVNGSSVGTYDISDISDIKLINKFKTPLGNSAIIHNVHVLNDFLVMSYYTDGIVIADAKNPEIIVKVGNYDTYPQGSGPDFNGCWEVYPYFPSGNFICSDISNGLIIVKPNIIGAFALKGNVIDSITKNPINGAVVRFVGANKIVNTDVDGKFKFGVLDSANFSLEISKNGYVTQTVSNLNLFRRDLKEFRIALLPTSVGVPTYNNKYDIRILENPISTSLFLEIPKVFGNLLNYSISDIEGKILEIGKINHSGIQEINGFNSLSNGIYFITVEEEGEKLFLGKVVKN